DLEGIPADGNLDIEVARDGILNLLSVDSRVPRSHHGLRRMSNEMGRTCRLPWWYAGGITTSHIGPFHSTRAHVSTSGRSASTIIRVTSMSCWPGSSALEDRWGTKTAVTS